MNLLLRNKEIEFYHLKFPSLSLKFIKLIGYNFNQNKAPLMSFIKTDLHGGGYYGRKSLGIIGIRAVSLLYNKCIFYQLFLECLMKTTQAFCCTFQLGSMLLVQVFYRFLLLLLFSFVVEKFQFLDALLFVNLSRLKSNFSNSFDFSVKTICILAENA